MIFRLTLFLVFGSDEDLDRYAVIHYYGQTSPRLYSKFGSREFVKKLIRCRVIAGSITKEELLAIEDAISNSDLSDEICFKDLREARLAAQTKFNEMNRKFMEQLLLMDEGLPDSRRFH